MQRTAVVGSSGSGKSTLAEALAAHTGAVVIELDALMHGPNWTPSPTPQFRADVMAAIEQAGERGWVVPGNYRTVADLVQRQADTIVWLDLPRRVVIWRLVKRSLRRTITRQRVWGGNRERLRDLVSFDPSRNVVLWSWQHHREYRRLYETYADGDFWSRAEVHRLRSSAEVEVFLESMSTP